MVATLIDVVSASPQSGREGRTDAADILHLANIYVFVDRSTTGFYANKRTDSYFFNISKVINVGAEACVRIICQPTLPRAHYPN
jgi:hypothetical protein